MAQRPEAREGDDPTIVLAPIIEALEADGYGASVHVKDGVVTFQIIATEDACADCLSPPSVLQPVITHLLQTAGLTQGLDLRYPPDTRNHSGQ